MRVFKVVFILAAIISMLATQSSAEDTDNATELAKKLANPIANLISVPLQLNYDSNFGPQEEGSKWVLNIQPVIPFSMGENWTVITRTIIPLIDQDDIPVSGMGESGLGDIEASQFFSPKTKTADGWTCGVGPIWLLPTASDDTLGSEQFGIGPTALALKQDGPWTLGFLFNHIWSVAGDDDRSDVNSTYLQPFVGYVTSTHTSFYLNTESTYNWENEEWSVPINFTVAQMLKLGQLPIQISVCARYWADAPDTGPEGWGGRFQFTFIFPK